MEQGGSSWGAPRRTFPFPHHSVSTEGNNYRYVSSVMLLRDQEPAWREEEQLRISLEVLSHASLGDQSTACEMGGLLLRNGCGMLGRGGMHFLFFFGAFLPRILRFYYDFWVHVISAWLKENRLLTFASSTFHPVLKYS